MFERLAQIEEETWWKLLAYLLSSLLGPVIALVLYVHYMREHNFFSYDFFREGLFGMKLFVLTSVVTLATPAFGLFGPLILYAGKRNGRKIDKSMWAAVVATAFLMWLILMLSYFLSGLSLGLLLLFLIVCFVFAVHAIVLWCMPAKYQFRSLVLIFSLVAYLPLVFSKHSAKLIGTGLSTFGAGGGIPILIHSAHQNNPFAAELILKTPKNLYIRTANAKATTTYPLIGVESYCVFGKNEDISSCFSATERM